jgi:hypothetical protein
VGGGQLARVSKEGLKQGHIDALQGNRGWLVPVLRRQLTSKEDHAQQGAVTESLLIRQEDYT